MLQLPVGRLWRPAVTAAGLIEGTAEQLQQLALEGDLFERMHKRFVNARQQAAAAAARELNESAKAAQAEALRAAATAEAERVRALPQTKPLGETPCCAMLQHGSVPS